MSNVVQFAPRFDRDEEGRKLGEEIAEVQRLTESISARTKRLRVNSSDDEAIESSITARMRKLELED